MTDHPIGHCPRPPTQILISYLVKNLWCNSSLPASLLRKLPRLRGIFGFSRIYQIIFGGFLNFKARKLPYKIIPIPIERKAKYSYSILLRIIFFQRDYYKKKIKKLTICIFIRLLADCNDKSIHLNVYRHTAMTNLYILHLLTECHDLFLMIVIMID